MFKIGLIWKVALLAAVLLAGLLIGSCSKGSANERTRGERNANANNAEQAIQITVGKSEMRTVPSVIQASGSLIADETSDIAPKVAGKVANVYANVGQFLTTGAVIAKIDDSNARQLLSTAQAGVKQAQAGVLQAEAKLGLGPGGSFNASTIPEVRAANANYQQALAVLKQAEANEKRYRELVESGDVAMIQYEQFRTTRDTARAQANNAKELLDAAVNTAKQNNQAIASARAAQDAAQAQVGIAQQNLADTVIRAPFPGYITNRQTAVGEFVTTATPVATIVRTNPMKIQIQIGESDVPQVAVGRGVTVQVDAYKDRTFSGTVSAVNPAIDPASRSAIVEALIENNDNALRAGMFATVRINKEGGTNAVYVPKAAVYNDPSTQSYRVFVVQDGVAKLKVVQLGVEEGDSTQILTGVDPDQVVATSNLDQLYEGAKVAY
ncbi:MAG TPA: efflux RND transporter periplasmic adaptor subunit [Pyrinomonadaceae bacterium]|nr:efflux RND transporter periplasmic adaptor subunit [Pyrinomonadaceae bacterium]